MAAQLLAASLFRIGEFAAAAPLLEGLEPAFGLNPDFLSLFGANNRRLGKLDQAVHVSAIVCEVIFCQAVTQREKEPIRGHTGGYHRESRHYSPEAGHTALGQHLAELVDGLDCERAFLEALDGNCKTPIAGQARVVDGKIKFRGLIAMPDGSQKFETESEGEIADAKKIGLEAGEKLKAEALQKEKEDLRMQASASWDDQAEQMVELQRMNARKSAKGID